MKYILNTGRYDRAYEIEKGNQKILITLHRRRVYMDTGNVAIDGITPVDDDDYALLEKNKAFARDFASKDETMGLSLVDESVALGDTDERTAQLEEENKKLKEEGKKLKEALKKAEKPEVKKLEDDNKILTDENAKLKAQLEALTAKKPTEDTEKADEEDKKADNEGF